MPKKAKKTRPAPKDYFDMKGSVEKDKKVKPKEVFGKDAVKKKPNKKPNKKVPKNSHRMPDGSIMKDSDMPKKKTKKKTTKKIY
tara:strand:+ start:4918 stop:5169 length:252 start_codon:yes stop_codon:yes gene_type:complete